MREQLKIGAARQSNRTGIDHDYEYIDPSELRRDHEPKTDTEAIEAQGRAWYDGITTPPPSQVPAKTRVGNAQFGDVL